MGTYMPWFPEPGSFIKKFSSKTQEYEYMRLMWRRDPFTYPFRGWGSVDAGSKSSQQNFRDLNPSDDKNHIYLAYLGLKPGFRYYLYHPVQLLLQTWDESPQDIDRDISRGILAEESPYDFPTKSIAIEHDVYPGIEAENISGIAMHPEIIWIAALYVYQPQDKISPEILDRLRDDRLKSYPWEFGGVL